MSHNEEYKEFLGRPPQKNRSEILSQEMLPKIQPWLYTYGGHWLATPKSLPKNLEVSLLDSVNNHGGKFDIAEPVNQAHIRLFDWMFGERMRAQSPYEAYVMLGNYAGKSRDNPSEWELLNHSYNRDKGTTIDVLKDTALLVDTIANRAEGSMSRSYRGDAFTPTQIKYLEYVLKQRAVLPTKFVAGMTDLANSRRMLDVAMAYLISLAGTHPGHSQAEVEHETAVATEIMKRLKTGETIPKDDIEYPEIVMEFEDVPEELPIPKIIQEVPEAEQLEEGRRLFSPSFERHFSPDIDYEKTKKLLTTQASLQSYTKLFNLDKVQASAPSAIETYLQGVTANIESGDIHIDDIVRNLALFFKMGVIGSIPDLAITLDKFAEVIVQIEQTKLPEYREHQRTVDDLKQALQTLQIIMYTTNSAHYPMYADMIVRTNIKEFTKKILHTL